MAEELSDRLVIARIVREIKPSAERAEHMDVNPDADIAIDCLSEDGAEPGLVDGSLGLSRKEPFRIAIRELYPILLQPEGNHFCGVRGKRLFQIFVIFDL